MNSTVSSSELIELCATDTELFSSVFFPQTVRQDSAFFHKKLDTILESSARLVNIQMSRGFGKTTKLRLFLLKRLVYGLARTVIYVGISQDKAIQSVQWIRKQIEYNKKLCGVFNLSKGMKWQETECEIHHNSFNHTITILAYGITGSIRGVNIDDYRPDLIVCDDILNEENTATPEQRNKVEELIYGALYASLAPEVDAPDAKMVMLQTPLNAQDASTKALKDPAWVSARYPCWTEDTMNLSDSEKESIWPSRFPTDQLRSLKKSYLQRNQASVWYREYECEVIAPEECAFKVDWLKYYDIAPDLNSMYVIGAIDPVPPPTELQLRKGMKDKDYEVLAVIGTRDGRDFFLLDYELNRGHEPNWTIDTFFRLSLKYSPATWVLETVGYQKTLEWLLRDAMKKRGIYFPIFELADKRKKFNRIVGALSGPASNGVFYCKKQHTEFIDQFANYPVSNHDDVLDAVAMGVIKTNVFSAKNPHEKDNALIPILPLTEQKLSYGYGAP